MKDAEFVLGVADLIQLPDSERPEVALLGRSNVGKSTLLNRVTNRKTLARTSSTPGRTQQFNFFRVNYLGEDNQERAIHLVDLPGFGYSKFGRDQRESLSLMTVDYLREREQLKVVCLLNDCRRDPEEDELAVRRLAFESGAILIPVITKVDKLNRSEREKRIKALAEAYSMEADDLLLTGEKMDTSSFWQRIDDALAAA